MDFTEVSLRQLIAVCYDGHQGYKTAADHAGSMELKRFFSKLADERKHFGEQLAGKLARDVQTRGSFTGALHRGWIDFKDKVGRLSQAGLLEECVRGEAAAAKHYEYVLAGGQVPSEVKQIITHQLSLILESRDRIAGLAQEGPS